MIDEEPAAHVSHRRCPSAGGQVLKRQQQKSLLDVHSYTAGQGNDTAGLQQQLGYHLAKVKCLLLGGECTWGITAAVLAHC